MREAGLAPVKGIKICTGYYCPVEVNGSPCRKVSGTPATFATHLSTSHTNASWKPPVNDREKYLCDYQTIFNREHRRHFLVFTGLSQGSNSALYEALLRQPKPPVVHAEQVDDLETRELSSLLKVTNWDAFVGPFRGNPAEVIGLIAFPSHGTSNVEEEKVLCSLHCVSAAWGGKIREILKSSSQSVRRLIGIA